MGSKKKEERHTPCPAEPVTSESSHYRSQTLNSIPNGYPAAAAVDKVAMWQLPLPFPLPSYSSSNETPPYTSCMRPIDRSEKLPI